MTEHSRTLYGFLKPKTWYYLRRRGDDLVISPTAPTRSVDGYEGAIRTDARGAIEGIKREGHFFTYDTENKS